MKRYTPFLVTAFLFLLTAFTNQDDFQKYRPNVLFIICDDLNDFVEGMGGHPQAITPNISILASQSVSFMNAHSNQPVCAPCRASLFTGIYPHTSGLYSFEPWYKNATLRNSKTIMELFRENGYKVFGTGKLLHHERPELWDEFGYPNDHGPWPFNGTKSRDNPPWDGLVAHSSVPPPFGNNPFSSFGPLSEIPDIPPEGENGGYNGWWDGFGPFYYENDKNRDLMADEKNVNWIETKLKEIEDNHPEQPFFLALGFNRPHTPLYVPEKYFNMYHIKDLMLPPYLENDLDDCSKGLVLGNAYPKYNYKRLIETYGSREAGLKLYLRAYLACVSFVDDQLGKVTKALANSPFSENTIIIFTSDHGYHLGEKDHLFKHTLWEESTRIPFIIKVPGLTPEGAECMQPVSLIDIYPTLVDLCDLKGSNMKTKEGAPIDGNSLRALLSNPHEVELKGPVVALSAILSNRIKEGANIPMKAIDQHFSVRSQDWRYSLANDGTEELYDHRSDPNEWRNLSEDLKHSAKKKELKDILINITGIKAKY